MGLLIEYTSARTHAVGCSACNKGADAMEQNSRVAEVDGAHHMWITAGNSRVFADCS
jgi:hypothetical protein